LDSILNLIELSPIICTYRISPNAYFIGGKGQI